MPESEITRFRADGFPLCPSCGEDELYSHVLLPYLGGPMPPRDEVIAGMFTCYRCNWSGAGPGA